VTATEKVPGLSLTVPLISNSGGGAADRLGKPPRFLLSAERRERTGKVYKVLQIDGAPTLRWEDVAGKWIMKERNTEKAGF